MKLARNILLIEDDLGDAALAQAYLSDIPDRALELRHVQRLSEAIPCLESPPPDIILLDLNLPDAHGITTFTELHARFPDVPVIVLSGLDDHEVALMTVREGAQDFIVKGTFTGETLLRAIDYAVERNRMRMEMFTAALSDELTGLNNRRGFKALTEQLLKSACRLKKEVFLLFVDLDGMKMVNDVCGHLQGDRLLRDAANLLVQVFRESDVLARIGGDEFAVFGLIEEQPRFVLPLERLAKEVRQFNDRNDNRPYILSLSVGLATLRPGATDTIDQLIALADAKMYESKRKKKSLAQPVR